jgi:hypothetical protein
MGSRRDTRIDFLRGIALLTIFIDHVPGNFLGTLTLRNFGFSDAAELFVLLAGVSSALAYGRLFEQGRTGPGLRRVWARCLRIYLFQIGLLLTTLTIVQLWSNEFGVRPDKLRPLMHGIGGLSHGLTMQALPSSLNILPVYVILLGLFPLLYVGSRRWPLATLLASGGVWVAVNLDHGLNLTNWLDGQGWFFNPFAWQFLFTIGIYAARLHRDRAGMLPRSTALLRLCWVYLGFALVAAAPWTNWGLDGKLLAIEPDKTALSPLRLADVLAFVYVLMCSDWFRRLAETERLDFIAMCGRHSLEVFSAGTLVALVGRLLFRTFGTDWTLQAMINGAGFACMIGLAYLLERPDGGTPIAHGWRWQLRPSQN